MNRNQIAVIASPVSAPASPAQRQTRSSGLYSGVAPATPPQTRRCTHCRQPRRGHPLSGCPNVDPPIPPSTPESPRQRAPRVASEPCYNIINQQQINNTLEIHVHASPTAPPALGGRARPRPSGPDDSSPNARSTSTRNTVPRQLSEDRWDHMRALLRAHPLSAVTIAMAEDELASEELIARQHGYAVQLVYPEDGWGDQDQGLFILARDAAALNGTYNRVRRAANRGIPLTTIVREESYAEEDFVGALDDVVNAMAGMGVGGSRRSRRTRRTST